MVLFCYRIFYPLVCVLAAPFWLLKMVRRGGWGSGLAERVGIYRRDAEYERQGAVYIHAVSVGEVLLALKLIARWREERPGEHFMLVPTTATGMAVAREKAPGDVRVIYAPLDFGWLIRRVMTRFSPRVVVLIESELWAGLLTQCEALGIPVVVANARLSPRSEKRLMKVRGLMGPILSTLDAVGVPEPEDVERWVSVGVRREVLKVTGNLKFDPNGAILPQKRPEFQEMLAAFEGERPIAMAISTFAKEEEWLAEAFLAAGALPVIVPRHAERRDEVRAAVAKRTGRSVVLRSQFEKPESGAVFIIDSTGELRDWTAHADIVVVGKSFFAKGGQNPAEAIQAGVPVVTGPHMANFEPLVTELKKVGGLTMVQTQEELIAALTKLLKNGEAETKAAQKVLEKHDGAVCATIFMCDRESL